jgi:DNA repair protein RecN (Recombination protein N)
MLVELTIRDFALIDQCVFEPSEGFNTLTGETGAGKSIIIDALALCLGARASIDVIRAGAQRAHLTALFSLGSESTLTARLDDLGIERPDDGTLILQRDLSIEGRSVSRINGQTVTLQVLTSIGAELVDIHGQSEHLSLLRPARQLEMLDHFGTTTGVRNAFARLAADLKRARDHLGESLQVRDAGEARIDLLRFQVQEIHEARLEPGEPDNLNEQRARLVNAERLAILADQALTALRGSDHIDTPGAQGLTLQAAKKLEALIALDPSMNALVERANDLAAACDDVSTDLRQYRDNIEANPAFLSEIEDRLDTIHRIERKYGGTVETALDFERAAQVELERYENQDNIISRAEDDVCRLEDKAGSAAASLSTRRKEAAAQFELAVRSRLARLGLGPAQFEVELTTTEAPHGLPVGERRLGFEPSGVDRIRFLVSFNSGEPLRPIERVASGGETARFLLAVKAALASADDMPTIIFDEIDTGVGGRSGRVIGAMLKELATNHQVIAITHLPQVASSASTHFKVTKTDRDDSSSVSVKRLTAQDRLHEIAEMLAGASPSSAALKNAAELLDRSAGEMVSCE